MSAAPWTGVAPSILSADFARLGAQVADVLEAGARTVHVDIMDGRFVPPFSMGPNVCQALRGLCDEHGAVLDVHLMVAEPERHVDTFAAAGADGITVHVEATPHVHRALQQIREAGCRAGLALNPGTPATAVAEVAGDLDLVLCMTVNPGYGGQPFIEHSLDKLGRLRELIGPGVVLEVDGGIDREQAPRVAAAGADLWVAGSAVFGTPDPGGEVQAIAAAATAGR